MGKIVYHLSKISAIFFHFPFAGLVSSSKRWYWQTFILNTTLSHNQTFQNWEGVKNI